MSSKCFFLNKHDLQVLFITYIREYLCYYGLTNAEIQTITKDFKTLYVNSENTGDLDGQWHTNKLLTLQGVFNCIFLINISNISNINRDREALELGEKNMYTHIKKPIHT